MPLWQIAIRVDSAFSDALGAALWAAGAGAVEEREGALVVWADSPELLGQLTSAARAFVDAAAIVTTELDESWRTAWTCHLVQERVADGFVVQLEHDSTPAPAGTQRILLVPRLAFGVGSHPTTRLAARAVVRACRERPGANVLDVGTGTGVLAMIAARSGACRVVGIDIDPEAVVAARENAALNEVDCTFSTSELGALDERFEIVVANLEAPTVRELAPCLPRRVAPGGALLVTGFLAERAAELAPLLSLPVTNRELEDDWCLLELVR